MSEPIIIAIVLTVFGIIVFCSYYFSKKNVIIRTLAKIPNKPASSLKTNELSKVTGKALHVKEPLTAPFSIRKCVFYQIIIEQKVSTGKSSSWKTLIKEERFQEFFVQTKTEFVIIKPQEHPKNYSCHLVKDKDQSSGAFNDPTPQFESLLKRYNIDPQTFFGFNKRLRYKEGIIAIGEEITVAGIAKWKTLSEPIPEYPYSKIATLESTDKQKIIITDLPEVHKNKR
ncbi:GIDE domain-containing protein [Psychroserpens ponticola]|uniref:RING-type E3 ubiquitin transferase n=1 Tax=Psychroserpens ponticola TaxID=2932268 RepID=A0ABY7RXI9_9FLAO|nr:GIDE domain-containing protein [Psychroserpens ponticola]WCO01856.1 GIDE domain-containing protein [Psychroserpens ponticola]